MKKILLGTILFLAFFGIIFFVLRKEAQTDDQSQIVKNVKTQVVAKSDIEKASQFSSVVAGEEETFIMPKMSGYITAIYKKEGDKVAKGETLAVLDGSEILAQVGAAQDGVNSMKNVVDEADDYYDQVVDEAKAALKKYEKEYDALKDGGASDSELSIAKKGVKQAEEAVKSAKKMRDLQNQSTEANLVSMEGQLKIAQTQAGNRYIKAPYSGVITAKNYSVGSLVSPSQAVFAIAKSEKKELSISVSSDLVRFLAFDQAVRISLDNDQGNFSGKIISVSPMTGSVAHKSLVKISIDESSDLRLGEFVKVFIETEKKDDVLVVPQNALVKEYYDNFVFVVDENNIVQKKKVEIGFVGDDKVEIVSGISTGERVVVEGQFYLKDGDEVFENF